MGDEIASNVPSRPRAAGRLAIPIDPVAPTLARFVDADQYPASGEAGFAAMGRSRTFRRLRTDRFEDIDLLRPADILPTLLRVFCMR